MIALWSFYNLLEILKKSPASTCPNDVGEEECVRIKIRGICSALFANDQGSILQVWLNQSHATAATVQQRRALPFTAVHPIDGEN